MKYDSFFLQKVQTKKSDKMKATAVIIIFFVFIYLVIFSLLTTNPYFFTLYNPFSIAAL
jgi:hypothetical protein